MSGNINLAYYRKEDWDRLISSIDDKESMHDTWEEWHTGYMRTKAQLILRGFTVNDFQVDIDELKAYCRKKGIRNDGKARSQFVSNQ